MVISVTSIYWHNHFLLFKNILYSVNEMCSPLTHPAFFMLQIAIRRFPFKCFLDIHHWWKSNGVFWTANKRRQYNFLFRTYIWKSWTYTTLHNMILWQVMFKPLGQPHLWCTSGMMNDRLNTCFINVSEDNSGGLKILWSPSLEHQVTSELQIKNLPARNLQSHFASILSHWSLFKANWAAVRSVLHLHLQRD